MKTQHLKLPKAEIFRRIFFITMGAVLVAVSLEMFLIPNEIIDGGITGISIMASYLTSLPIGLFLFFLNIPFFIIGYKQIGKTFALSSLYGVLVLAFSTQLLHNVDPVTHSRFIAPIIGGVILGAGVGLVIRFGGSLDGTEILAILFNKSLPFSVGEFVMFFNLFILGSAGFVYDWDSAMFSMIAYYIAFKAIDMTVEGFDESKSVWIISENAKDVGDTIMNRLGRGVTYLQGEGGFTGGSKKVIFCVVTRLEEAKLKSIVQETDPAAFLAIGTIHDVKGGRFKKRDIH